MRIIPDISDLLLPLDEVIKTHFIPALTGRGSISELEMQLLALPTRLGGLGIAIPSKIAPFKHFLSVKETASSSCLCCAAESYLHCHQCHRAAASKARNQDAMTSAAVFCC